MAPRTRGQMALIGLMAIAFVVIMVLYFSFQRSGEERRIDKVEEQNRLTKEMLEQLERIIEDVVRTSVYEAANAVGQTGGFTAENIPEPHYHGLPVFFYKGTVTNVPTEDAMKRMLRFETARRIESNLHELIKKKQYRVSQLEIEGEHIEIAEEDLQVGDMFVKVKVNIPIKVTYADREGEIKTTIDVNLPLRIFRLRKLAYAFVHLYAQKDDRYTIPISNLRVSHPWYRKIEFWIDYIVNQDFRLPRPSTQHICKPFNLPDTTGKPHFGFCLPGDKKEIYIPFEAKGSDAKSIKGSFGDDVVVATTIFSSNAQTKEYQRMMLKYLTDANLVTEMDPANEADVLGFMKGFNWNFNSLIGGMDECYPLLNLTLNGKQDNLQVEGKTQKDTGCFQTCSAGNRYKSYKANYSASFPVEVAITDLLPTGKILGGSTLLKPLQFRFVIYPYLELGDEAKTDITLPTTFNDEFDLECAGRCSLSVRIHGPREGEVIVEPCKDKRARFTTPDVTINDVPCGIRDVRVIPSGEYIEQYAPLRTKLALPTGTLDLHLSEYYRVEGIVMANTTIYCQKDEKLHCYAPNDEAIVHPGVCEEGDRGRFQRLGFIGGMPPSYITVQLIPLNTSLEYLTTNTDVDGRYVFEKVLGGNYLLLTSPNRDFAGNIGYKVKPFAEVSEIERDMTKDVIMNSVFSVNMTRGFVPVYRVKRC